MDELNLNDSEDLETEEGNDNSGDKKKRRRSNKPFPVHTFEYALELAEAVQRVSSGKPIRKVTLFNTLDKAPGSNQSRDWITSANKYGLVKGSYAAEMIELTEQGFVASSEDSSEYDKVQARADLAIMKVPVFKALYEEFVGTKLPSRPVLIDSARNYQVPDDVVNEAVDIFLGNVRFVGLLQLLSGAERLITFDHLLEETLDTRSTNNSAQTNSAKPDNLKPIIERPSSSTYQPALETTCFYITPIGNEGSEYRQHADLFLGSLVEPALQELGLRVKRADLIDKPGVITRQIIEYILRSKLVIADLSFHNPNVFYELALRHATKLPTVHLIRLSDNIPFDVNQSRVITIDTTSIYTLVPRLESYRAAIANQVRQALEDPDSVDNPLTTFYPSFQVHI
jgi:hypothetical protein